MPAAPRLLWSVGLVLQRREQGTRHSYRWQGRVDACVRQPARPHRIIGKLDLNVLDVAIDHDDTDDAQLDAVAPQGIATLRRRWRP